MFPGGAAGVSGGLAAERDSVTTLKGGEERQRRDGEMGGARKTCASGGEGCRSLSWRTRSEGHNVAAEVGNCEIGFLLTTATGTVGADQTEGTLQLPPKEIR